jgi:predicted Zn-dependent protease
MTEEPTQGFQMSGRRAFLEIAIVLGLIAIAVIVVVALVKAGAGVLANYVPTSFDRTLGDQAGHAVEATSSPCTDPGPKQYVESIAAPLVRTLDDKRWDFRFIVVENDEINAFALPGGFVTVNMGLLANAETGDEVAAVLAHELHHVVYRHGTRRMLRQLGTSVAFSAVFGSPDVAVPASVVRDFLSNAYDRSEESEADAAGLALLTRAGVDPSGMARFFERLEKTSLAPPAIISTHPDPGDRAEKAAKAAKGAKPTVVLPSPKGLRCK